MTRIEKEIENREILAVPRPEIFIYPSGYIFWDETGADFYGPYHSYMECLANMKNYCELYLCG